MEDSVLVSTKTILGLEESYTPFDLDIITHINVAFSTLNQLAIGPTDVVMIEDSETTWSSLGISTRQLSMVKTYVFLKVRMYFDPPTTSFLIEAVNNQIAELEWRLTAFREEDIYVPEVEDPNHDEVY